LIERNKVDEGVVYLEVTRGAADRDFFYPEGAAPTVVAFTQSRPLLDEPYAVSGVKVITLPDLRWKRRDIKSTSLLAQTMGKQEAKRRGAYEAWMVEDGFVTEGTSSNAFIVDAEGRIRTIALSDHILHGVTRAALIEIARERQMKVVEAPFTVEEAKTAREAFISAASNPATPVIAIDNVPVGKGRPGPVAQALRAFYLGAEAQN
jgi:D-alanine transaminase